jgi:hypothetical protein
MPKKPGNPIFGKLSQWLVPASDSYTPTTNTSPVTNNRLLTEILANFDDSVNRESVGSSLLFNAHFLILLHPDTYEDRQNAFPVVVGEVVSAINTRILSLRSQYGRVSPVASAWFFKFGGGTEFGGEPILPTDVRVVGSLTGLLPGNTPPTGPAGAGNLKATRRVQQTNRYEKVDFNQDAFRHIDFREPGAFVVKFSHETTGTVAPQSVNTSLAMEPPISPGTVSTPRPVNAALAQLRYYMAETNDENTYQMRDREVVIARRSPDNQNFPNYLLLESGYVSNPHARIRYNDATNSFQIASFSRNETRVNETLIPRSEPASPVWHTLPNDAQILLNSMVTLHFHRNP